MYILAQYQKKQYERHNLQLNANNCKTDRNLIQNRGRRNVLPLTKDSPTHIPITIYIQKSYQQYSDVLFQLHFHSSIRHFQLNAHFHHKLLSANNLIILTIKTDHHTFPLLNSQLLLIHQLSHPGLENLTAVIFPSPLFIYSHNH